jgi:hypothetical protein
MTPRSRVLLERLTASRLSLQTQSFIALLIGARDRAKYDTSPPEPILA